jgi:hypothetical protein
MAHKVEGSIQMTGDLRSMVEQLKSASHPLRLRVLALLDEALRAEGISSHSCLSA